MQITKTKKYDLRAMYNISVYFVSIFKLTKLRVNCLCYTLVRQRQKITALHHFNLYKTFLPSKGVWKNKF